MVTGRQRAPWRENSLTHMSVSVASPTSSSNRPASTSAALRTTTIGSRTKEELRSSRRSASLGEQVLLAPEDLLAPLDASGVHDVSPEEQDLLLGCRAAEAVDHGLSAPGQHEVVVIELLDPLAGGQLRRAVHVLDQRQGRTVPDVAVAARPVLE